MTIEKGKTSNGYAKWTYLDSPDLAGGGYLTFIVSVIKNTTTKIKILIMYLSITTTSFSDLKKSVRGWHNRPAFTLFSVLPFNIGLLRQIVLYNIFRQNSSPFLLYYAWQGGIKKTAQILMIIKVPDTPLTTKRTTSGRFDFINNRVFTASPQSLSHF